jgi:hypothetical protein
VTNSGTSTASVPRTSSTVTGTLIRSRPTRPRRRRRAGAVDALPAVDPAGEEGADGAAGVAVLIRRPSFHG